MNCQLCQHPVLTVTVKKRENKKLSCAYHTADILFIFIFTEREEQELPQFLCYKYFKRLGYYKKKGSREAVTNVRMHFYAVHKMQVEWESYVGASEFPVCDLHTGFGIHFLKNPHTHSHTKQTSTPTSLIYIQIIQVGTSYKQMQMNQQITLHLFSH